MDKEKNKNKDINGTDSWDNKEISDRVVGETRDNEGAIGNMKQADDE